MSRMSDRTVHGYTSGGAPIVRYDRAGRWYVEFGGVAQPWRRALTVAEAAELAAEGRVIRNQYGGQRFNAAVRAIENRATASEDDDGSIDL